MLLLLSLLGCSIVDKVRSPGDPMCDAICVEQSLYTFTKTLDAYTLSVSFRTDSGEVDTLDVEYSGTPTGSYSTLNPIELTAQRDGVYIFTNGMTLENVAFEINNTEVLRSFVESYEDTVCGSVCTISDYTLNTDNIESLPGELTIVGELNNMLACANDTNFEEFYIIAHNDDHTQALILREVYAADGGSWENGFNNENLSVELHIGTNVGVNYCTDTFDDGEIAEVFTPIDPSEVPAGLSTNDVAVFSYGPELLDCEDCEPFARLSVENFWFVSEEGNYATIELISELQSDIWFNYGG